VLQRMDNISDLTKERSCTWQDYKNYWEVWFIPSGYKRPTYDNKPANLVGTAILCMLKEKYHDDTYSNAQIQHKTQGTVKTRGWVRYRGSAQLYNASALDKLESLKGKTCCR
jgi:hypothetical protein